MKFFKSNLGFSLVEVLLTGALIGLLGVGSIKLLEDKQEHSNNIARNYVREVFLGELINFFSDIDNCTRNFGGLKINQVNTIPKLYAANSPTAVYSLYNPATKGPRYSNRAIGIASMSFGTNTLEVIGSSIHWKRTKVSLQLQKMGIKTKGGNILKKELLITAYTTGNTVMYCFSSAGGNPDMWRYTSAASTSKIYYQGRNDELPAGFNSPDSDRSKVSVGSAAPPDATLDIKGDLMLDAERSTAPDGTIHFGAHILRTGSSKTIEIKSRGIWQELLPEGIQLYFALSSYGGNTSCPPGWRYVNTGSSTIIQSGGSFHSEVNSGGTLMEEIRFEQMPRHTHSVIDPTHRHDYDDQVGGNKNSCNLSGSMYFGNQALVNFTSGSNRSGITFASSGSQVKHVNTQPAVKLTLCKKVD